MNRYSRSILFFGAVVPFVVLGLLLVAVFFGGSNLRSRKALKEEQFKSYQSRAVEMTSVQDELGIEGRADQMAFWDEQLSKELVQSLTQNLNEVTSEFSEDQLTRTEFSRPGTRSSFAGATENSYSRFRLSFEGGFGPMQKVLTELEIRMPQLVLESIEIGPVPEVKSKGRLRFDATYLAWSDDQQGRKS